MKNLLVKFEEFIPALKESLLNQDRTINGKIIRKSFLRKTFPGFLERIDSLYGSIDSYKEILYCLLKDIDEVPKCKNPKCNNLVPLKKFHKGLQTFCCVECQNEWQRNSEDFRNRVSQGVREKNKDLVYQSSTMNFHKDFSRSDKNNITFHDYCKHGDVTIYLNTLTRIEEINKEKFHSSICLECNKETFQNYTPSKEEILKFQEEFPDFYKKHSLAMKKDWWMRYYPKYWKILHIWFSEYFIPANADGFVELEDYKEMYYVFLHRLKGRPLCKHKDCKNLSHFIPSTQRYSVFCEEHQTGYNSSGVEIELEKFIITLGIPFVRNTQSIIKGELDFYFPEKNLAIEFNGCWFHSDKFKPKDYHKAKWIECRDKGIQLILIWEDDWNHKKEIVKSMLCAKLGKTSNHIGARKCEIREVSYKDSVEFLDANHLQGNITSKYRYGLYYNEELVSLVTFGNSRFKKGELELLRYCTKLDWNVAGGFSKLMNHIIKKENINRFISYANCDISNGSIYKKFGMREVSHTENWGWFDKGQRVNRFNKKFRLGEEKALAKCYTSGTLKFEYNKSI